ncbi:hypothetical protein HMPREF3214_00114 [Alloscardovia omnicolens]|nr:hypothetical protein HMPREF3214_00114 [Alloscardovia omnicolens]
MLLGGAGGCPPPLKPLPLFSIFPLSLYNFLYKTFYISASKLRSYFKA